MNCWALNKATKIKTIGLCHSVQHTAQELANDLGILVEEINYKAAGINHMAIYLNFEHQSQNLYPHLQEIVRTGKMPDWNRVRYEMLTHLGYFVTESSEHCSEYVPYFIKNRNPELIEHFNIPLDEYPGHCINLLEGWHELKSQLEDPKHPMEVHRSVEYGSLIIHSLETGTPRVVYSNVHNDHLIENLPLDSVLEVPVLVDKNGLQPTLMGKIPPQLVALMQTNINVQSLTVETTLTGKKEAHLPRRHAGPTHQH